MTTDPRYSPPQYPGRDPGHSGTGSQYYPRSSYSPYDWRATEQIPITHRTYPTNQQSYPTNPGQYPPPPPRRPVSREPQKSSRAGTFIAGAVAIAVVSAG